MADNKLVKILVVDDNPSVLETMRTALENDYLKILTALDGKQAFEKLNQEMPDLFLLDVNLPDINGFEICRQIKANASTAQIPVIMITGDKTVDIDKGFSVGADDCMIKPIDINMLIARMTKLIKKQYKLLVIEDDRQICSMLEKVFDKQKYIIETHFDGVRIFDIVNQFSPDLILLDISLPAGPDGIEICRKLKESPYTKHIPVIMLTANEHTDAIEKSFSYGAEDYILKPFTIQDLFSKVEKYLLPVKIR